MKINLMKRKRLLWLAAGVGVLIIVLLLLFTSKRENQENTIQSFFDDFEYKSVLEETGEIEKSANGDWWVDSGGTFIVEDGVGKTIQGEIEKGSRWQVDYFVYNPQSTDDGYHPQNIFRLITRSKWLDFREQAYFRIIKDNFSNSSNRDESNGLLLFSRYKDEDNLYYAGVRVDGAAVIKKKVKGEYFILASAPVFEGEKYEREKNPSLLSKNQWLGLRVETKNMADGSVDIRLYLDKERNGDWQLILSAKDDGRIGGKPILGKYYAGIRTDFMDVEFDDFNITAI